MTARWEFSGGALCLDFVNTLSDRPRCRDEKLPGPQDLLGWSRAAGILDPDAAAGLGRAIRRSGPHALRIHGRALALRERLYRIFSTLAAGARPEARDLEALNRDLAAALRFARIDAAGDGFVWGWSDGDGRVDRVLWPVLRSAADLLASDEVALVRECDAGTCSWLFVDRSRTRRRRWCDMKSCGNRAKARRHYRRKKQAG